MLKYERRRLTPGICRLLLAFAIAFSTTAAHSAAKTVLVLGDSLSAEYGLARGTGWVALLEQRLQQKKVDAAVVNASISGETTSGGKTRLPELLKRHHPSIVIIELGGNDALRGLALAATENNFRDMIAMSREDKAKVLLVGMQIPPNYGRDYTEKFAAIYPKIAKDTKTPLVPFLLEGVADKPDMFQPDRIHVLAKAHPTILDNIWPNLNALLSGK
jgi:acyl-CoA thioesterase-1